MARISVRRVALAFISAASFAACSPSGGGPVEGPADAHCGKTVQATDQAVCMAMGTPPDEEEHATLYGAEGDDDDCKYHVEWSASDVVVGSDATITVIATNKTDGGPLTGAKPYAEVYLDAKHPLPSGAATATEDTPGTYTFANIAFDAAGKWTMRFHFFGDCTDVDEASPHAHIAFYVSVP